MYNAFKQNNDIVVASRFIEGGSMTGCPFIKSLLVIICETLDYYLIVQDF